MEFDLFTFHGSGQLLLAKAEELRSGCRTEAWVMMADRPEPSRCVVGRSSVHLLTIVLVYRG